MNQSTKATGISPYYGRASWNTYEREFKRALAVLRSQGVQGGVFGDLYQDEHRKWVEGICAKPGVTPLLPLWEREGKDLLRQFIAAGFEAVVIAIRTDLLDPSWLGSRIDGRFIHAMDKEGVDLCGEKGEYHTLVVDGPIFRKKIVIRDMRVTRRKNMGFLDILNFEVEEKRDGEDKGIPRTYPEGMSILRGEMKKGWKVTKAC